MKNLTATLIDLNKTFEAVPSILNEIEIAAMKGKSVIQVATQPSIVFDKLGYDVTECSDRWVISWTDPRKPSTERYAKSTAWSMKALIGKFQPIRELCFSLEAEAHEAALFGSKEAQVAIPASIDRASLRDYVTKVYPTDDVEIKKDNLAVNWDPDKDYL